MEHGSLQARETELEAGPIEHRPRKLEGAGGAALRQARQLRAARVRKPQELGRLVECLARGVVPGIAQNAVASDATHLYELRMSSRDEERHVRKRWRIGLEQWREQMPFQVVHAHGRHPPGIGQAACQRRPREQRPDQPWAGREGDAGKPLGAPCRRSPATWRTSGRSRRT